MLHTPLDAVPDISDVQVIVATEWAGRSPDLIEDQITYPLVTALVPTPKVKAVRGFTDFGISYVLRHLRGRHRHLLGAQPRRRVPAGDPRAAARGRQSDDGSGCDGRGVGVSVRPGRRTGRHTLADLRSFQDWYLRRWLASVPGVAEVATIGGFEKQYQVSLDPVRLASYKVSPRDVVKAIQMSNNDVEGRLLEFSGREYMVRGRGYLKSVGDIEQVAVRASERGTPVRVGDVARVAIGPELRRGAAELDGQGEAVGGIIVMRFGENALRVIDRVKARMRGGPEIAAGRRRDRADLRPVRPDPRVDRDAARDADRGRARRLVRGAGVSVPLPIGADSHHHAADCRARVVHPDVLPRGHVEHHVARRYRAGDRRAGGRVDRHGRERLSPHQRAGRGR